MEFDAESALKSALGESKPRVYRHDLGAYQPKAKATPTAPKTPVTEPKTTPPPEAVSSKTLPNEPPIQHSVDVEDSTPKRAPELPFQDHVYWKGLFEKNVASDGSLRMRYVDDVKTTQVGGVPIPMIENMQDILKKRHIGKTFDLYHHSFEITDRNRVLTTRTGFLRYALIMAYRTDDGLHVQYAKQLAEATSDILSPVKQATPSMMEARDVYLMVLADWLDTKKATPVKEAEPTTKHMVEAIQSLERMMNVQMEQQQLRAKRQDVMQTVVLLDRLGLLKGGVPKDVGDILRILEANQHLLQNTEEAVTRHIAAEEERQARIARNGYTV